GGAAFAHPGRSDGFLLPPRGATGDRSDGGTVPGVRGADLVSGLVRGFPAARACPARGRSPGLPLRLRAGARARSEPGRVRQRVPAAAALGRRAVDVHGRARARRVPRAAAGRGGREPCVRARAVPGERQAARARALSYFSNPGQTVVVQPALPLEEMTLPSA